MRGGAGWYSPGAPSGLAQIVPYLSSLYTVFHSVIYNSVVQTKISFQNLCRAQRKIFFSKSLQGSKKDLLCKIFAGFKERSFQNISMVQRKICFSKYSQGFSIEDLFFKIFTGFKGISALQNLCKGSQRKMCFLKSLQGISKEDLLYNIFAGVFKRRYAFQNLRRGSQLKISFSKSLQGSKHRLII